MLKGFLDEYLNGGPFARQLTVPVLDLIGARDHDFCTPPDCPEAGHEASFYPASPDFRIITIPRTAHNLNLHLNAADTTDIFSGWAEQQSA